MEATSLFLLAFERATWLTRCAEDSESAEYRAAEAVLNSASLPPDQDSLAVEWAHGHCRSSRQASQPKTLLCFASYSTKRIAVVMVAFALLTGALAAAPAYAAVAQR